MTNAQTSFDLLTTRHAGVQRVIDQAVADRGIPGIAVEIRDEQGQWFSSAGTADTTIGRKREPHDQFRIGSATKTFTATVVLQLVGEGKLSLDDTVDKWLPGLVVGNGNDGSKISIRRLLNHTSGLYNYTQNQETMKRTGWRPDQLAQIAMEHTPNFEPGQKWEYSNTNYILAGMIVERLTGNDLADEMLRRIVHPLGLTGTYLTGDEAELHGPHAQHYSRLMMPDPNAPVYDVTDANHSWAWATGGMVSTTADLLRFLGALLGGHLLPPVQSQEMFDTISTDGGNWIPNTRYGLGVFSQALPCGVTVWGSSGFTIGSWTYAMGTRDGKHFLVSNANGDWGDLLGTFKALLQAEFCPEVS